MAQGLVWVELTAVVVGRHRVLLPIPRRLAQLLASILSAPQRVLAQLLAAL